MPDVGALLDLCRSIAARAGRRLLDSRDDGKAYVHSVHHPKEIKALADTLLEEEILRALAPTGLAVISEETGAIAGSTDQQYRFIVDPLDGTFNYVKGLGPSAVSIGLWKERTPIFGVIYSLSEQRLFWGGCGMNAYCDSQRITVSRTSSKAEASICTGFPVRFDLASDSAIREFRDRVAPFAKVRMLGSAAASLLHVADGSADAYCEQNIMLWDVAAGLAIVEGAGGTYHIAEINSDKCSEVYASNGTLRSDGMSS
jgi:myo-inositol-1(or 4)-monophosphatase